MASKPTDITKALTKMQITNRNLISTVSSMASYVGIMPKDLDDFVSGYSLQKISTTIASLEVNKSIMEYSGFDPKTIMRRCYDRYINDIDKDDFVEPAEGQFAKKREMLGRDRGPK